MKLKLILPLLFLFIANIHAQKTTSILLDEAYEQAKQENKNVLIIFKASWCKWCKTLEENLNNEKVKSLMDANYITIHLTVKESKDKRHQETPGAHLLLDKYMGKKAGLPFWLIFDKNRGLIGNSYGSNGKNMGCPSTEKEIVDFKKTLKKTSKLTDEELTLIGELFLIKKVK